MSPTSYQTAPSRTAIIARLWGFILAERAFSAYFSRFDFYSNLGRLEPAAIGGRLAGWPGCSSSAVPATRPQKSQLESWLLVFWLREK
ncbi:hypothetical protein ACCQ08_18975, partial [Comamonas sp. SY3]|uniref:hypothetical protein n=1 Tax=Comamonas sp. SY3 TaxID=3243601 RepID=UPI0035931A23